jgi:hypothetical protein
VPLGTEEAEGRVRITRDPLTETAVGVTAVSPTKTVNNSFGAVVALSDSLNVSVTMVPLAATVDNVGGAISGPAVELFVTEVADNEMASLPAVSWMAELVAQLFGVGAVYDTVTTFPASTAEPSVNCTTEELIDTLVTSNETPFTITLKSVAKAVVAFNVSSYARDKTVPVVFNEADNSVGAVVSPTTVELFVTGDSVNEIASLPAASCTAALLVAEFGVGAA